MDVLLWGLACQKLRQTVDPFPGLSLNSDIFPVVVFIGFQEYKINGISEIFTGILSFSGKYGVNKPIEG